MSIHGNTMVFTFDGECVIRKRVSSVRQDEFIVGCCYCNQPAVKVDSLFPYHSDYNRCKEHKFPYEPPAVVNGLEAELRCWQRAAEIFVNYSGWAELLQYVTADADDEIIWLHKTHRFALAYAIAEAETRGEVVLEGTE